MHGLYLSIAKFGQYALIAVIVFTLLVRRVVYLELYFIFRKIVVGKMNHIFQRKRSL